VAGGPRDARVRLPRAVGGATAGNSVIAGVIVDVFGRFAEGELLDGIMAHLMILCGGNAHATGLARSSSVYAALGAQAQRHS
jgi:hypothetical protein